VPRLARRAVFAVVVAGAGLTLLVSVWPTLSFAYRSPVAHVAVETAAALIGGIAAYLMLARFRLGLRRADLLVAAGLGITAAANLVSAVTPAGAAEEPARSAAWVAAIGGLAGVVLLALSAVLPDVRERRPHMAARRALLGTAGGFLAVALAVAILGDSLPVPIDPALSPGDSTSPRIVGNAVILAIQLLSAGLLAVAAIGFLRRAEAERDELAAWLAIAVTFSVFSRVNYFLFPSRYSDWVFTGDVLRLGFYIAVLVGVVREIAGYQPRLARDAALEERRRVARDLHDGLSQELAFIAGQSATLVERRGGDPELEHLRDAAQRAVDESRIAIAALSRPADEPVDVLLGKVARELGERVGSTVKLDLAGGVQADEHTRETLLRIVREAVSNAARHAGARTIAVRLQDGPELRVTVRDDGCGFDAEAAVAGGAGLGLLTMRERAEAAGGRVEVRSQPGEGTTVELVLPR
jgi:signal transduction histidine kinase